MKRTLVFVVVLVMIVSMFGAVSAQDGANELNWNLGADPKTMDPGLNGASDGGDVINQTFEGLVREKSGIV